MIRGLLIRQLFILAEALLWALILIIGGLTLRDVYSSPVATAADGQGVGPSEASPIHLAKSVGDRANYDSILASKIFGPAAAYVHGKKAPVKAPTPEPPVNPETTETKLPLVLKGAVALGATNPFSSAIIEVNQQGLAQKVFFIGDEVIDRVFLLEVFKDEVLLDNKRANRHETLKYELDISGKSSKNNVKSLQMANRPLAETAPQRRVRASGQQLVNLHRSEITAQLEADYEKLASTIDVEEVRDDDGNLKGLTTGDIESISSLQQLGFRNGDILVSINNEKVTGQGQITSLANKYRNATIVRVGILRGGKPMNMTYRIGQ
ncbi:MAG: type II secretion system protein N [Candidatus Hydrogenedentota bacterium]